jgi:hypothetical protein
VTPLVVDGFDTGFPEGEVAYNGLGRAASGLVYFSIGTCGRDAGARLFAFDPADSAVRTVADLDAALPKREPRTVPQGKVHVDLALVGGALHGATHIGYCDLDEGIERPGTADGYAPYPGGWFFAIEADGRGERIVPLVRAPKSEGLITMSADAARGLLYALTWPHGWLVSVDVHERELRDHGAALPVNEAGSPRRGDWGRICRSLGVDPRTGAVYWSDESGRILCFDGRAFATIASTPRGQMWRKVDWHPGHRCFYGVLWDSAALFRFDPDARACEEIGRVPATAAATLGFVLDPERDTLHVLTAVSGRVSYVTCDVASRAIRTHGTLRLADGRWITRAESLLLGDAAYSLCWTKDGPMTLVRFAPAR